MRHFFDHRFLTPVISEEHTDMLNANLLRCSAFENGQGCHPKSEESEEDTILIKELSASYPHMPHLFFLLA